MKSWNDSHGLYSQKGFCMTKCQLQEATLRVRIVNEVLLPKLTCNQEIGGAPYKKQRCEGHQALFMYHPLLTQAACFPGTQKTLLSHSKVLQQTGARGSVTP